MQYTVQYMNVVYTFFYRILKIVKKTDIHSQYATTIYHTNTEQKKNEFHLFHNVQSDHRF